MIIESYHKRNVYKFLNLLQIHGGIQYYLTFINNSIPASIGIK